MEKSKSKSNFCIRPFNSATISADGRVNVCCHVNNDVSKFQNEKNYNIKETNLKTWWDSDYLNYLRSTFLENKRPDECSYCWKLEDEGLASLRTRSNYEYKAIFNNDFRNKLKLIGKDNLYYPEDVQVSITNLCNLKCQMCSGTNSSKLLIENNALGFEKLDQKDYNLEDNHFEDIKKIAMHDLKMLKLLGGEPLFNPKVIELLKMLVDSGKSKEIKLHVTTNGTVCNDKIIELLNKFNDKRIMLSIDATEKCNDYVRYPSNWKVIEKNVKRFRTLPNTYMYINTVVQNLNILYLDKLIHFANENKIFLNLDSIIRPSHLDFLNLPKSLLQKSLDRLLDIKNDELIHTKNIPEIIKKIQDYMKNGKLNDKAYTSFTSMIRKRDAYRKVDIKNYMPELAEEI